MISVIGKSTKKTLQVTYREKCPTLHCGVWQQTTGVEGRLGGDLPILVLLEFYLETDGGA